MDRNITFTNCQPVVLDFSNEQEIGFVKTAANGKIHLEKGSEKRKIIEAEIKKHPNALFFRSKSIEANIPNQNGDCFSEEELKKSYKTFEGVPFFTNHDNQHVENAKGKVIFAEWIPEEKAVYTIQFVDRDAYPNICRSIEEDYVSGVSMGSTVEYSTCSICENRAEKPEEFCSHIKNRKGRKFSGEAKSVRTGKINSFKDAPIFEWNYGLKFIELSAVVDPACPTCHIQGIIPNDDYLKVKVANLQNELYMVKTAALEKHAAKEDIDKLEQVLKTLEEMAVKLIQNRKQIEPEFASDLVTILTQLQEWTDELTAAGFGNFNPNQAAQSSGQTPAPAAPDPGVLNPMGVSETSPMDTSQSPQSNDLTQSQSVGKISGDPTKPLVSTPKMPVTPSIRPKSSNNSIIKTSAIMDIINNFVEKYTNTNVINHKNESGDTMARRTLAQKEEDKNKAITVLSNSWKEKRDFIKYIENVPSLEKDNFKLSINKNDDTFVIVAQTISEPSTKMVWDFENLNDSQKEMIINEPSMAADKFLESFANSVNYIKEGAENMSQLKTAGANTNNSDLDNTTQKQLDKKDLYHARTNKEADETTQGQLDKVRSDKEADETTQGQLDKVRTNKEADETTQGQLNKSRTNKEADETTQGQLGDYRGKEQDETTEAQLNKIDSAWKRVAKRDASKFVSASAHMQSAIDAIADVVIVSGATPTELCEVVADVTSSSQKRHAFASKIILDDLSSSKEYSQMATRLAYWAGKNVKLASLDGSQLEQMLALRLSKVAAQETINPDVLMSALDVVSEGGQASEVISAKVDAKLQATAKIAPKTSVKDELRQALAGKTEKKEASREDRRKLLEASVSAQNKFETKVASKATTGADHIIETSFEEIGFNKNERKSHVDKFKSTLKSFAKGGLAANNMKLAAITNVTIDGDTIQIAVQTDNGDQKVEIPIGDNSAPAPEMPEGDMSGENLGNTLPPAQAGTSKKKLVKAQAPSGGGVGGQPGVVPGTASGSGAANQIPGETPVNDPVQALTVGEDDPSAPPADETPSDEIPGSDEQQMPWSICPECGTSDVDITNEDGGNIKGTCKNPECGCQYEALVKKQVEFKLIKPTKSVGKSSSPTPEAPEAPEVPALPVAASINLDAKGMKRMASNEKKHGHVCPACGTKNCKIASKTDGVMSYLCKTCGTTAHKTIFANPQDPSQATLQVSWDMFEAQNLENCGSCKEEAQKFASQIRSAKLLKSAAEKADEFPMTNCMERVARKWGTQTVASYGPCKGKVLAECVCKELQKLGFTTVRHLERFASVSTQPDPQDICVEEKTKEGFNTKEANSICECLKKKAIKEASKTDPVLAESFDNPYLAAYLDDIKSGKEKVVTAQDLISIKKSFDSKRIEASKKEAEIKLAQQEKELNSNLADPLPELKKEASKPKIEAEPIASHADVPSGKATIGNEGPENIDVKPVEFKSETKKNTKDLPDIPTGDAYMGNEKETQKDLPPNLNEMTGNVAQTVASTTDKLQKEADLMKEIDSIVNDVDVKAPSDKGVAISDIPATGNATIGNEEAPKLDKVDVPLGDALMGNEGDTQKELPPNNHEMLKNVMSESSGVTVSSKRSLQLEKIAKSRELEAIKTASWLASTGRIGNDKSTFDDVVKVLTAFPTGDIGKTAEKLFPSKAKETKEASVSEGVQAFTVPVQEVKSAAEKPAENVTLASKLSGLFSVGSQSERRRLDFLDNK